MGSICNASSEPHSDFLNSLTTFGFIYGSMFDVKCMRRECSEFSNFLCDQNWNNLVITGF